MAKNSSKTTGWTLIESRINYSVQELEDNGVKIFASNQNRLQDTRLISTFKNHLKFGGRFETPGKLVNASECLKAGRVLYRQTTPGSRKNAKITSVDDFWPAEKTAYDNGLALVVFDGNHRYNAMLKALEDAKTSEEKRAIKSNVFFTYSDIKASDLATVFLEINTQVSSIDNQDYIPYILKNWGATGDPIYEFDYALDACQRAKYSGEKKRDGLFNFTAATLICAGGIRPRAYSDKENLFLIAKRGKSGLVNLPAQAKSNACFLEYILVPYVFEKNVPGLTKMEHDLIFKNTRRFLQWILELSSNSKEVIAFANFLSKSENGGGKDFLRSYTNTRTLRDATGSEMNSNLQRQVALQSMFTKFQASDDWNNINQIVADIHTSFDNEVLDMETKEASYVKVPKTYGANHKNMINNSKLSVCAMYVYKNERD